MKQVATKEQNQVAKTENSVVQLSQQMPQALSMIEKLVANPEVNVEALGQMVDLQIKMMAHQAKMDYSAAMSRFNSLKKTIQHNRRGKTAGNTSFTYADFPTTVSAISPWLTEAGLSFAHREDDPVIDDQGNVKMIMVYCVIKHNSGHSEEFKFPAIPDERLRGKVSPSQLIQLAITYAKRQTLAMGLGLATAEDSQDSDSTKAGHQYISDEEVEQLQKALTVAGVEESELCKRAGVDELDELRSEQFKAAMNWLRKKANG